MGFFGDGKKFGVSLNYSMEKELLGTGGGLVPIKDFITEDTLIVYGDVAISVDFSKLHNFHARNKALVTAAVHPSHHPEDSDLVEYDKNFLLERIMKKPHKSIPENPHNLAALYIFSSDAIKYLSLLKPPFDIAHDLLQVILDRGGKIFCYNTDEFMMDTGTPERLEKVRKIFKA
jgi:NDP-sugar pyrophosphorylase family protein